MLFVDTPFDAVFAIDAVSGKQVWTYDPGIDRESEVYIVSARGVALWHGKEATTQPCGQHRVFVATLDRRLIARDAASGEPCDGFGFHGTVDLAAGLNLTPFQRTFYGFTSPPTVVGDVVIVGSSVGDNQSVAVASGVVRGYDVRTGRQLWAWNPLPWAAGSSPVTGGGNAWSVLAADPEHDLVTGTPYVLYRTPITTDAGVPCAPQPFGALVAINLDTGAKWWIAPQGSVIPGEQTGNLGLGGPVVTAAGLVFIAGTLDPHFRAFDSATGKLVWETRLPVPANATPMTYMIGGRQYLAIAAGGHGMLGTERGDAIIAFALPDPAPKTPPARHR